MLSGVDVDHYNTISPWRRNKSVWQAGECSESFHAINLKQTISVRIWTLYFRHTDISIVWNPTPNWNQINWYTHWEENLRFSGPPEVGKIWPLCPKANSHTLGNFPFRPPGGLSGRHEHGHLATSGPANQTFYLVILQFILAWVRIRYLESFFFPGEKLDF